MEIFKSISIWCMKYIIWNTLHEINYTWNYSAQKTSKKTNPNYPCLQNQRNNTTHSFHSKWKRRIFKPSFFNFKLANHQQAEQGPQGGVKYQTNQSWRPPKGCTWTILFLSTKWSLTKTWRFLKPWSSLMALQRRVKHSQAVRGAGTAHIYLLPILPTPVPWQMPPPQSFPDLWAHTVLGCCCKKNGLFFIFNGNEESELICGDCQQELFLSWAGFCQDITWGWSNPGSWAQEGRNL